MSASDFEKAVAPYQDQNYFVGGHPVPRDAGRQSDNAGMFTAEMLRIINDIDHTEDPPTKMKDLLDASGVLHRYPDDSSPDLSPDNMLGFLNYCSLFPNRQVLAKRLFWRGVRGLGSYTPSWSKDGFLFRQPQLVAALISASGSLRFWKFWQWPLVLYAALVIAVGGYKKSPMDDQDSRRLTWHLARVMEKNSLLCRLASKVFFRRLRKDYGDEGMRLVFARYFTPDHPFAKFALNPWEIK